MNTQVNINTQLLEQAMQVTHMASTQELLERVLRQVVENPVVAKAVFDLPQVEFGESVSLEALIEQQGVQPFSGDTGADFWSEDESLDEFLRFNAQQRQADREL